MNETLRDPENVLESAIAGVMSLREIVVGFGEAQTMIRAMPGDIRYWSRGAERLYGWSTADAFGHVSHELLRTEFPLTLDSINHRLAHDGFWRGELMQTHRNGERLLVATHWMLQAGPDAHVVEVNNDISARMRAEAARRYHDALVADSDDAIIAKTLDGVITSWNQSAERMFGWSAAEAIGQPILIIIPPDKHDEEAAIIARLAAGQRIEHFETVRQRRDGGSVQVSLTVSPIRDATGAVIGASKIARDITSQRQADLMLQRFRRMTALGELTGGVAHDFNNLLSVIVNNVNVLRMRLSGDAETEAMTRDILTAAMSGAALSKRLLTFSRRQELNLETVDLHAHLASYVALLRRTLGDGIGIEMRFAEALWPVRADAGQIGDALINLALNARDAMPASGGRIIIETANVEADLEAFGASGRAFVTVAVSDNGAGMTPDVLERAIEPFFSTKAQGQGNGLGLSMVHGMVSQHGGHVDISSAPGAGTTVRLYFPRADAAEEAGGAEEAPVPESLAGRTVMVVEDNAQLRGSVVRALAALGYRALEAADAMACITQLEAGAACDLLFTDILMPNGLTGLQLARIARRLRPGIRVLLTTGSPADAFGDAAMEDILPKPYRMASFAAAVRAALLRGER